MQRFIARENVRRFRQQLESCTDERQSETLRQLLAAEEAKLNQLERTKRPPPSNERFGKLRM